MLLLKQLLFIAFITVIPFSPALAEFKVPAHTGRVVDQAKIFNAGERQKLENAIIAFEKSTGGQLAVTTLENLQDATVEEAAVAIFDQWKLGDKDKDNGALLVIVPGARKIRLEVGYGWEGDINDARAGDVIREMAPYFRKNQYADGVLAAVNRLEEYLTGKISEGEQNPQQGRSLFNTIGLVIFIFVFVFLLRRGIFFIPPGRGGSGGGFFGGGGFSGGGFSGGRGGSSGGGGASGGW